MSSSQVASQVHGSAVAVANVRLLEVDPGTVLDFRLASPDSGTVSEELVLEVKGSIVTRGSRAEAIEVVWGREAVRELAIDASKGAERKRRKGAGAAGGGFHGVVGALGLPPSFRLVLVARLEDGRRIGVAEIVGRRESVEPGPGWAGPRGAFVSSPSGRTGTTWIVQLLGQHPQVLAHPPFGVEPRPASYWIEAAMALTEPGSYKRILRPNMDHDRWWLGEWTDADRGPIEDPLMRRYLGERRSREIAAWAREQIVDFYRVVAEGQGKADADVFVEKAPMGRLRLELLGDLLPGTREIALFRDPRDTLCSILAYSERNPRAALVSTEPGTHDDFLEELAASFRGLLAECRERPEQTLIVRYEDLITDQMPTLRGILDHLEVESSDAIATAMVDTAAGGSDRLERHKTSGKAASRSIGRWERDMDPGLRSRSADAFRDVLADLGYRSGTSVVVPGAPDAGAVEATGVAVANGGGEPTEGLRGLVRTVDARQWRHVYSFGDLPSNGDDQPAELGALLATSGADRIGVWLERDGRVVTETYDARATRPHLPSSMRWILAPLRWRDTGRLPGRFRRVLGRLRRWLGRASAKRRGEPRRDREVVGYLHTTGGSSRLPLFSAIHPITGDQLLSTRRNEAEELGYRDPTRLGYVAAAAPLTRVLGWQRTPLPWAYRLGGERRAGPAGARGALARPADSRVPRDALRVSGWAIFAGESVSRVDVLVNGSLVGRARIGIQRPKLKGDGNPEAATAGFDLRVPPSSIPAEADRATVEAVVVGEKGSQFRLAPPHPIELTSPIMALSERETEAARPRVDLGAQAATGGLGSRPGSDGASAEGVIRVAAFAHSLDTGGAQRTLFEQLQRLQETGRFAATVVAPRTGALQGQFEELGIPVHVTGEFPIAGVGEYEDRLGETAAWVDAQRPDVIVVNTLGAFIGIDVATRLDVPSAWIIHESYELPVWWQMMAGETVPDAYIRSRCYEALRATDAAIFPADATRVLFEPYIDRARMFTAPCGVEFADIDAYQRQIDPRDARRQLGLDPDSTLVLSLGIMEPRKGQGVLARAWSRINRGHPNAELALVGATDSVYCAGVRRYIEDAGIGNSCRLLPPTSNPWAWHAAADFFVLSSDIESAPVVLAEAMAFETPSVATAVFGVAELIRDQRDGFLCQPNDVDDLARTLDRVLRLDREQLRRIAGSGNRRARDHHDPDRFVARLGRLLTGLARDRERMPTWG
jgi:glycosyltransferase involved in cell wall biosynthesis